MRSDFLLLIWFSFFESTVARGGHSTSSFVDSRTHYDTTMSHSHSHGNISSSTPATSLSTKTTTTPNGSEFLSEETVENPDISGCSWPKDYLTRLDFCQRRAELTGKAVRHGSFAALNNGILSNLLEDCRRHHLQCGRINVSRLIVNPADFGF